MNTKMICAFGIFAGTLAGCSSTSTTPSANQFGTLLALAEVVGADFENVVDVSVDDLPDSADMNGVMNVFLNDTQANQDPETMFIGAASVAADFQAGTLSGDATEFGEYKLAEACDIGLEGCTATMLQSIDGSLDISGDITGVLFTYNASGTVSGTDLIGGESVTANLDMDGSGGFATVDGALVAIGDGQDLGFGARTGGVLADYTAANTLIVSE